MSRTLRQYGLAVLTVTVALAISWPTPLDELSPTALFFAAVMISSWYGGLGPGLLATALAALAIDYLLMAPAFSLGFDVGDLVRIGVFVLEAVLISWLNNSCKRLETTLRQQNQELLAAHRYKDEFLAALGHELRNPLAAIRDGLQFLKESNREDHAAQQVCEIGDRQVRYLTRITDDLLDISRINRGKVRLIREVVELAPLVDHAVEVCRPLVAARRHQLDVALPPHPVHVHADPTRLQQVLVNLVHNAAKYTEPEGRVWLSVELDGQQVVIRVRDSGIGIAPDLLPSVFDYFTQSELSLDRADGGLGIGLSLVRGLVELHHGSVEAHSDGPGKGSEFIVRLPVTAPPEQPLDAPSEIETPNEQPCRVLVVDDHDDAARMLAMLLELWGYDIHVANDGPTALEIAPDFLPQVVLLDIGLPGMDGYRVAEQLRAMPKLDGMLLIALTGHGQDEDRRRSEEAGFDRHIVKPVDLMELRKVLARLPAACQTSETI